MKRYLLGSTVLRGIPPGGMGAVGMAIQRAIWWPHTPFERLQVLVARMENGSATRDERAEAAHAANNKVKRLGDTELAGALKAIAA
jgi:hypothetical protein